MAHNRISYNVNALIRISKSKDLTVCEKLDRMDEVMEQCDEFILSGACRGDCEHCNLQCMHDSLTVKLINDDADAFEAAAARG